MSEYAEAGICITEVKPQTNMKVKNVKVALYLSTKKSINVFILVHSIVNCDVNFLIIVYIVLTNSNDS